MTQQKSENPIVPEGLRKLAQTQASADESSQGGGKGIPVNEVMYQPELSFATAENLEAKADRANVKPVIDRSISGMNEEPKAESKRGKRASATMERVIEKLGKAWKKVAANKGSPGSDGITIDEIRENLSEELRNLKRDLESGEYEPQEILRVFIPKPGGKGERGLGIPNVRDRIVQEAIRQVIEPLYEPEFHPSSHGFRPGRSCHTAIKQAKKYVDAGYEWVVDFDLAKFFDRVHHQRLMAKLAEKIGDKQLLILIGKMLKAKVLMPEGVVVNTEEGVPQGGPLSPLLSNIVLDELDQELERRGHCFVRYADDSNIFVKSERAGKRVMASVVSFLEKRLRLEVNQEKSAVARPSKRHFVGFKIVKSQQEGGAKILLSQRSRKRINAKVVELTPRNWGNSMRACIERLNAYLTGWMGFFGICSDGIERELKVIDAHIRRRLRAILLKHWKRKKTIARKLIAHGTRRKTAWRTVYRGKTSTWKLSHSPGVHVALPNSKFADWGLESLLQLWQKRRKAMVVSGEQLLLPLG